MYYVSFLNQDSFLNRAFLNRDSTVPISKNGPDMASVHKFWYFLLVIHSFSLTNFNFWTKLCIRDFKKSQCLGFPDDPTATNK